MCLKNIYFCTSEFSLEIQSFFSNEKRLIFPLPYSKISKFMTIVFNIFYLLLIFLNCLSIFLFSIIVRNVHFFASLWLKYINYKNILTISYEDSDIINLKKEVFVSISKPEKRTFRSFGIKCLSIVIHFYVSIHKFVYTQKSVDVI